MTDESPVIKVSRNVVEMARLEVAAFRSAGLEHQIDPFVQQIANVHLPEERIALDPKGLVAAAQNLEQQILGGEGNGSDVIRVAPIVRAYLEAARTV